MFCTNCGKELPDGSKFCTQCGAVLGQGNNPNILPETPIDLPDLGQEDPQGGKGGKGLWILLAVIIFLIVALVAGGAWFVHQGGFDGFWGSGDEKHSSKDDDDDDEEDEEDDDDEDDDDEDETGETEETEEAFTGERYPININVRQVDNTRFPEVTFYATITDENGEVVEGLQTSDFKIEEIDKNGNISESSLETVEKTLGAENINVNLVLDASGSMNTGNKMGQAKEAAESFLNQVDLQGGDKVEIISFDDFVYLEQGFTSRYNDLSSALYSIGTDGSTALLDAIYAGLTETYNQDGAKCVIAFTDGEENASSYTYGDVVNLAQNTGIPVFIIGIGTGYDTSMLQNLAAECSGGYYSADETELSTILEEVYMEIYREQQDYYTFSYRSNNLEHQDEFRSIRLSTSETAEFYGEYEKEYIPVADLTGGFSADYANKDFMINDSDVRALTESDLSGMSLAELRIARNEIFARHGRQFKDSMLNKWFYSKNWYLNLPEKYTPGDFDKLSPSPLSKLERENTEFILAYEQNIMDNMDIYPDADTKLLSEYDLCLSKPVLKRAMQQLQSYPSSQILTENKELLQEAIDKEEIQY